MKQRHLVLGASIAAALAQPVFGAPSQITQTVNNNQLVTLSRSHFGFASKATAGGNLPDASSMSHLQLILAPTAAHRAQMEAYIASQHAPQSSHFQQWLSPAQFGSQFGVSDSDIAAITAWLTSEGFSVNTVYPNKLQIDFSGTAGQVKQAFHTQEAVFTLRDGKHLMNTTDISVPAALKNVVVGVMGLNDFHARPLAQKAKTAQWDASRKGFVVETPGAATGTAGKIGQAIQPVGTTRGLVPNDLMTMYDIRQIRANGVTGKGVTIAVVDDADMVPSDWTNFVSVFNLGQYGGTFAQVNPAPPTGTSNCLDPNTIKGNPPDFGETLLDAEWATAIAPGAHIVVATCSDTDASSNPATKNFFGGVFIAASNLINNPDASARPNILSASYGYGEFFTDPASKAAIDLMWAQADAEGISVFVSTGDSGSNPSFNGGIISGYEGNTAVDANSFATSPHVTGVGGNDLADVLDGTTSKYFAPTPSAVGGSALSYVPEIPWNESCGNGVAALSLGFSGPLALCQTYTKLDTNGDYVTSEAGSGGPSSVDAKPSWQRQVFDAAPDQSRDLPDVSLFAGSYGGYTAVVTCTQSYPCAPDFSGPVALSGGTSLASPMFAGIQALMDQGLSARGLPTDQGNAAPTLYALAALQYGTAGAAAPNIGACSADNGAHGSASCVFHNITRGSISTNCFQLPAPALSFKTAFHTANCYYYGMSFKGQIQVGLTSTDAAPTSYTPGNKAFSARPGWSFTSGLGSVDVRNLLIAWRAFDHAPPASTSNR